MGCDVEISLLTCQYSPSQEMYGKRWLRIQLPEGRALNQRLRLLDHLDRLFPITVSIIDSVPRLLKIVAFKI